VWVFQEGRLEGLPNHESSSAIDRTQPIPLDAMGARVR